MDDQVSRGAPEEFAGAEQQLSQGPPADGGKIDRETAELEFDRFALAMDFDMNEAGLSLEDKQDRDAAREKVISAIRNGSLVVNDSGQPEFTPRLSEVPPFVFRMPTGADLQNMERFKERAKITQMYAFLGGISGRPVKNFAALKMRDLQVCMALAVLFMG